MGVSGPGSKSRGFLVHPSSEVLARARSEGFGSFEPSLVALEILARGMRARQPKNPRVLIAGRDTFCPGEDAPADAIDGSLPVYNPKTDIVVRLPEVGGISDHVIMVGIAQDLLRRTHERQQRQAKWMGIGGVLGGIAVIGGGAVAHVPSIECAGACITSASGGLTAYLNARRQPALPDLSGYIPPVHLAPRLR